MCTSATKSRRGRVIAMAVAFRLFVDQKDNEQGWTENGRAIIK